MTPEEIAALVAKTVSEQMAVGLKDGFGVFQDFFKDQLKTHIEPLSTKIKGFEDALTAPEGTDIDGKPLVTEDSSTDTDNPETSEDMKDPATKALTERLARMEAKELERETALAKSRFGEALRKAIAPESPMGELTPMVEELLSNRYQGLVETEGSYYNAKGEKLEELVKSFFQTPEGQIFKPAKSRQGSGQTPPDAATPPSTKGEPSLDDMLKELSF